MLLLLQNRSFKCNFKKNSHAQPIVLDYECRATFTVRVAFFFCIIHCALPNISLKAFTVCNELMIELNFYAQIARIVRDFRPGVSGYFYRICEFLVAHCVHYAKSSQICSQYPRNGPFSLFFFSFALVLRCATCRANTDIFTQLQPILRFQTN